MFDRGLTVLRIRGIPIKLHVTLLIFLPYVAFVASTQFSAIAAAVGVPREALRLPPLAWGLILAVGLFVAILAHELAHSLVALKNGIRVRSITLMMLGGVSQIEEEDPEHEAWMAFAGPLTSLGIAAAFYALQRLIPGRSEVDVALLAFAITNAFLGVFNLLPAFPMDGGRVLRGVLSRRIGRDRATRVATSIGKGMAVLFGLWGLLSYNFILILIAVFVYMGASAEQGRLGARDLMRGLPALQLMTDRLADAYADESAPALAERLLRDNLVGARVIGSPAPGAPAREIGVVTAWDLSRPTERGDRPATVGAAIPPALPRVHARDDASPTIAALASGEIGAIAVLDDLEHVIGIITPAEIQRALALIGAIESGPRPAR
ncbi:MAG: site-2 protease family protein [Polyangiaceae bacterium]|nr:site-2 protease family protein [Polyangiaceae bacterium]